MSREFPLVMPKMSMTMSEGELLTWFKTEGDSVSEGDVLAEIQTDKVAMELESPVAGVLSRVVARPGTVIDVGAPIAYITTDAEDLMEGLFDAPPAADLNGAAAAPEPSAAIGAPPATAVSAAATAVRSGPVPVVPLARRRAAELGVSLDDVVATGRNGRITVPDVERAGEAAQAGRATVEAPAPAPAPAPRPTTTATPASKAGPEFADALAARRRAVRLAVARTMSTSAAVPQFTVFAELDLEPLSAVRNQIGWTTLFVRGLARALRGYPGINAGWDADNDRPAEASESIGVALAIDSAVGLLAPVVRDPDLLGLLDLDEQIRATVDRTRAGRLGAEDIRGATTTLSNLGGFGVPSFTSLLTPPQASALSVGAISVRPVVTAGNGLAARLGTTVGLTVDHRAVDGADAARLLRDLRQLFSHPDTLMS